MAFDKRVNLRGWKIDGLPMETIIDVSISFKYPPLEDLLQTTPSKRIRQVNQIMRSNINAVLALDFINSYTIPKRHPRGMKLRLPLGQLPHLCTVPGAEFIWIDNVAGMKKPSVGARRNTQFFCVKMTVAIQIEGVTDGMQSYEERYVLIKATSCADAYQKVELTTKDYSEPYINSAGYQVRWKVESVDDCYETGIRRLAEFNQSEGVEVFSVLKKRRMTTERSWDGNAE